MQNSVKVRSYNVDCFKGICILGVLLHHLSNKRISIDVRNWLGVGTELMIWVVVGFVAVSGYLQSMVQEGGLKEEIIQRFNRLIIPYFIIGACYALLYSLTQRGLDLSELITRLVTANEPIGEQLYFLPLLFLATVMWLPIGRVGLIYNFVVLSIISVSYWFLCFRFGPEFETQRGLSTGNVILAVIAYAWGYIWGKYRKTNRVFVTCMLSVYCWLGLGLLLVGGVKGLAVIAVGVGVLTLFTERTIGASPITWLGQRSSWIYAYHSPFIIYPALIILLKIGVSEILTLVIAVICAIFGSVLVGLTLSRFAVRRWFLA